MRTSNFSSEFTKNDNQELILREAERDELAYYLKRRIILFSFSLSSSEISQREKKSPTRHRSLVCRGDNFHAIFLRNFLKTHACTLHTLGTPIYRLIYEQHTLFISGKEGMTRKFKFIFYKEPRSLARHGS